MDANELLDILYTVPYNKLINGTVDYRVRTFTNIASNLARVDIDFNNTIDPTFPEEYERNTTYKCYSKCFEAMERVIAYLEILGFRNDR